MTTVCLHGALFYFMTAVIAEQDLDWLGLVWLFTSVHAAIELVGLLPQLLLHYEPWTGPVLAIWFGLVWLPQVCTLHTPRRTGWYCSSCTVNCGPCPRPVCATCAALLRFGRRLSAGQGAHSQHTTETFLKISWCAVFTTKEPTNSFLNVALILLLNSTPMNSRPYTLHHHVH